MNLPTFNYWLLYARDNVADFLVLFILQLFRSHSDYFSYSVFRGRLLFVFRWRLASNISANNLWYCNVTSKLLTYNNMKDSYCSWNLKSLLKINPIRTLSLSTFYNPLRWTLSFFNIQTFSHTRNFACVVGAFTNN